MPSNKERKSKKNKNKSKSSCKEKKTTENKKGFSDLQSRKGHCNSRRFGAYHRAFKRHCDADFQYDNSLY